MSKIKDIGGGLLVVKRETWETSQARSTSFLEKAKRYGGFDGQPWPGERGVIAEYIENGLVKPNYFHKVQSYYRVVSKQYPCVLLYLSFNLEEGPPDSIIDVFTFKGFDHGFYDSEYSCFSALLHEVILDDRYEELEEFRKSLNVHLLFPSQEIASRFSYVRTALLRQGKDLESAGVFRTIAIFGER